jgi:hypothetical protein
LHHNNVVGRDGYGDVRAVYIIGRILPPADVLEREAGALTGIDPEEIGYRDAKRLIHLVNGRAVEVSTQVHPDPLCERLRWQRTEGNGVQVEGRDRQVNRTAETPVDVVLWTDVPLPELGPVEAELWEGPTLDERMLAEGVWVESASDAAKVWPDLIVNRRVLEKERGILDATFGYKKYLSIAKSGIQIFEYRLQGHRGASHKVVFLNAASPTEARAFLESRLGPMAVFQPVDPSAATATADEPVHDHDDIAAEFEDLDASDAANDNAQATTVEPEAEAAPPEPAASDPVEPTIDPGPSRPVVMDASPLYVMAERLQRLARGQGTRPPPGNGNRPGLLPGLGGGKAQAVKSGLLGRDLRRTGPTGVS